MTVPAAIGGVGIAGSAIGSLVSGFGQDQAQQAQAAANTYKAGVAQLNKQINLQNAAWATEAGGEQAAASGMKSRQQIAETKVTQAASGFDVNSGTGEKVRQDQTNVAQYDQNVISWNAAKTSYGYETKATMDTAEAQLDTMAASGEKEAGDLALTGSFINAGSSVASKWLQGSQLGMFSSGGGGGGGSMPSG